MKTAKDIQEFIFNETGLKTSASKQAGSMKGYIRIMPIFQNGHYPSIPFDFVSIIRAKLIDFDSISHPVFCSTSEICVYQIEDNRIEYKKERKQKEISEMSDTGGWGSKNSQFRLNKKSERYANLLRKDSNRATYY